MTLHLFYSLKRLRWRQEEMEKEYTSYTKMEKLKTPCDEPIEAYNETTGKTEKTYKCPYADGYTGYEDEMCRVCCGLGVDE